MDAALRRTILFDKIASRTRRRAAVANFAMAEEKKIIVDEDWKTRVEAEKAAAQSREAQQGAKEDSGAVGPGEMNLPPASFEMLLTTLATEAMVGLGQIPHPATGKPEPNLEQAKYFIDMLDVVEQKTKGNLSAAEAQGLEDVLHQLRIAFVAVQQHSPRPSASS